LIIYQALGDQVHEPGPRKPSRHFYWNILYILATFSDWYSSYTTDLCFS
jgi:hypothetical protein